MGIRTADYNTIPASLLKYSGGSINIGGATAPAVGQALMCPTAGFGDWETPALLTGNPWIDPPTISTPDAWNEEFSTGSSDLAVRGWTVWATAAGVALTRVGDVVNSWSATQLTSTQYRSTRVGSVMLIQIPDAIEVVIIKASSGDHLFLAQIGNYIGGTGMYCGLILSTATSAPYTTANHNSGAGPGWSKVIIEASPSLRYLARNVNAATFTDQNTGTFDRRLNVDVFGLDQNESSVGVSASSNAFFVASGTMQVVQETGNLGCFSSPHARAGVVLFNNIPSGEFPWQATFSLGYIRRYTVHTGPY